MEGATPMKFTWTIEEFSKLNTNKLYSDIFIIGGHKWRILMFPKGNNVNYLSIYLDAADSSKLPAGWSRYAKFSLTVVNQMLKKLSVRKDTQHDFNDREDDWGFTSFMPLSDLGNPSKGYLVNDTVVIEAEFQECLSNDPVNISRVESVDTLPIIESVDGLKVESPEEDLDVSVVASHGDSPCQQEEQGVIELVEEETGTIVSDEAPLLTEPEQVTVLEEVKSAEDSRATEETSEALKIIEKDQIRSGTVLLDAAATTNTSKNSAPPIHTQLEGEPMNVKGFSVLASQAEAMKQIFEKHPDLTSNFRPQNHRLRSTYMEVLFDVVEMLCRSPQELSENDLSYMQNTLNDLDYAGLQVDWLKTKLEEVSKRKEQSLGSRLDELSEQFEKIKQMMLNLELQLEKEKAETTAARAPLSLNDII